MEVCEALTLLREKDDYDEMSLEEVTLIRC